MEKITGNTPLSRILHINPGASEELFDVGLHCMGCAFSGMETLEEGCMSHGMSQKEINALIKRLNK